MYKTVEDLYTHIKHDRIAAFVKHYGAALVADAAEGYGDETFYALGMAFLAGHVRSAAKLEETEFPDEYMYREFLTAMSSDLPEGIEVTNNLMHLMHTADGDMRKDATHVYADIISGLLGVALVRTIYIPYKGDIVLTGKDEVPETVVATITDKVKACGAECYVRMGWMYSHLDMGETYGYTEKEDIAVEIFADTAEALKAAMTAVEAMEIEI